jgi:hypothetical protein
MLMLEPFLPNFLIVHFPYLLLFGVSFLDTRHILKYLLSWAIEEIQEEEKEDSAMKGGGTSDQSTFSTSVRDLLGRRKSTKGKKCRIVT